MRFILSHYLIPGFVILASCSRTAEFDRADQMKAYLSEKIPIGTQVDAAQKILKTEGFRVFRLTNEALVEQGNVRKHLDYLYGDRSDGFIVSRRWQVAAVLKNGKVTEILVSTGLVGP